MDSKIVGIDGKPVQIETEQQQADCQPADCQPESSDCQPESAGFDVEPGKEGITRSIVKLLQAGFSLQRVARAMARHNGVDPDALCDAIYEASSVQPIEEPVALAINLLEAHAVVIGVVHNSALQSGIERQMAAEAANQAANQAEQEAKVEVSDGENVSCPGMAPCGDGCTCKGE